MATAAQAITEQTRALFGDDYSHVSSADPDQISLRFKRKVEYDNVRELPRALAEKQAQAAASRGPKRPKVQNAGNQMALVKSNGESKSTPQTNGITSSSLVRRPNMQQSRPEWHAPWKLMRVISGHLGWVRALAVEPNNQWTDG